MLCDGLGETAEDPFILLIDNCQHLGSDEGTAEALDAFVQLFPDNGQLIMAGRSHPPLKLAQLRLRKQLVSLADPAARAACLDTALKLYRGPFLEEFPDLAWCRLERENLRRLMA